MAETIGRLIKRLRLQAGYESLGELYRASGVQVSTLSRIESGSQIPQPDTLKKLAPYLHASVEQLMIAAGHLPGNNKAIQNSSFITLNLIPSRELSILTFSPTPSGQQL